jgi:hypothetical protein
MPKCDRRGCFTAGKSICSGCGTEQYCGSVCQKLAWKEHKPMCSVLKKFPKNLLPYQEVVQIINEIQASKNADNIKVLDHLLLFAEHQFGKEVPGVGFRERADGQRISNWNVNIKILHEINGKVAYIYKECNKLSRKDRDDGRLPYLIKSLDLLRPWLFTLNLIPWLENDSDSTDQIDSLDKDQINYLLEELFSTEHALFLVCINRNWLEKAEEHIKRCVSYSRNFLIEGEQKITMKLDSLHSYVDLRSRQCNHSGAVAFAEEAYNILVVAYDCVHPQVQTAAGKLISCLIEKGDLFNAERFAQVTYSNLKDHKNGMDQEGEEMAVGSYNLASVIHRQRGDLIKAEKLAREALRIRNQLCGSSHIYTGISCMLVARILDSQGKLDKETKELFERSLAILVRNEGPNGANVAVINTDIGQFYHKLANKELLDSDKKKTQLLLAKSYFVEAVRILSQIFSSTHPNTVTATYLLNRVLKEL